MTDADIHAWLIRYIRRQTMLESLDWIAEQLKLDAVDGHEYTKAAAMEQVREAWGQQVRHVRQEM